MKLKKSLSLFFLAAFCIALLILYFNNKNIEPVTREKFMLDTIYIYKLGGGDTQYSKNITNNKTSQRKANWGIKP